MGVCLHVGGGGVESDVLREKRKMRKKIRLKVKKKMREDLLTFEKSGFLFLKLAESIGVCARGWKQEKDLSE